MVAVRTVMAATVNTPGDLITPVGSAMSSFTPKIVSVLFQVNLLVFSYLRVLNIIDLD
jgi:hypothetical protein